MAGDPFLYASGPEEAQACVKAGLGFEIVPGVSSVNAVPAYAGIPLTTKDNREVAVVTCGEQGRLEPVRRRPHPGAALGRRARSPRSPRPSSRPAATSQTPVAMTRVGTTTEQATVTSTLEHIAADARAARMAPPAVTVVGDVVNLREALSWFETKPLFGWRVLVPRTKEQAGSLTSRLRGYGAVPEEVPTISVEPPRNPQQMDKAVRGLVEGRYEWIAFTSVNAVKAVREKFEEYGLDARAFSGLKIAAVGDKTAQAIAAWGLRADLVPVGRAVRGRAAGRLAAVRRGPGPDQPGVPAARRHRHREPRGRPDRPRLGVRRRHGVPHRAGDAAAGADPRRDQDRQVRRGRLHLVLDRAQPGRHRRQAAPVHRDRGDRPGHRQDRGGARPAGRRTVAEAGRRGARGRARRLRRRRAGSRCWTPASRSPSRRSASRRVAGRPPRRDDRGRWRHDRTRRPAASPAHHPGAAPDGRGDLAARPPARAAAVRARGDRRPAPDLAACPASSSTPAPRCSRP